MNDMDYAAAHGLTALLADAPKPTRADSFATVDPANVTPYEPDWPDLVRLHRLVRARRVTTVMEFGCGYSTVVMAHALAMNREEHGAYVAANLRRSNAFEIHAVDDMRAYLDATHARMPGATMVLRRDQEPTPGHSLYYSAVWMGTFNGRACTEYCVLPNVCPDLVYLDGPSQHSVIGDASGIHTRHADRLPMSCDVLKLEHFLLPGTLIVVDGRTANARFLRCNLQRSWTYAHDAALDVHTFELVEPPLGKLNERQIRYCLGDAWMERVK